MKSSMTNSPKAIFCSLAIAAVLYGCGLASHGGIIDNGNQPSDPGRRQPVPTPSDDQPQQSSEPTTAVSVLSAYVVDVPTKWAPKESMMESNIVTFGGNAVMFTEGTEICDAQPTTNGFGVDIYACSATMTILHLGDTHYVVAKHKDRNDDIDLVLFSFRRK
jgi:hypothetical protein